MAISIDIDHNQEQRSGSRSFPNDILPRVPEFSDVLRARKVVRRYLSPTPLIAAPALSAQLGFNLWFKCETALPTGAFKVRGGLFLVDQLPTHLKRRGVVTASTGNHGQSIAYAAQAAGVQATIFVPEAANDLKVAAMRLLGARVEFAGRDFFETCIAAIESARENESYFVHPANEPALVAGVATYAVEILEELPDVDVLFVPVGGGSGLSGASIIKQALKPSLELYGVQATGAPASTESWRERTLLKFDRADTFAEGIATREAFELPSLLFWDRVNDMVLVNDTDIRRSMLTIMTHARVIAEGAGAASLAAAVSRQSTLHGKNVVCVVSGGNVTMDALRQLVNEEQPW